MLDPTLDILHSHIYYSKTITQEGRRGRNIRITRYLPSRTYLPKTSALVTRLLAVFRGGFTSRVMTQWKHLEASSLRNGSLSTLHDVASRRPRPCAGFSDPGPCALACYRRRDIAIDVWPYIFRFNSIGEPATGRLFVFSERLDQVQVAHSSQLKV